MSPTFITRAGAAVAAALALAACLDQPAEARTCGKQAIKLRVDGKQRCVKAKQLRRTAGNPATALSRLTAVVGDAKFMPRPRGRARRKALARMRAPRQRMVKRVAGTSPRAAAAKESYSSETVEAPPGQVGTGSTMSGSGSVTKGGHTLNTAVTFGSQRFTQRCPGIAGELPATIGAKLGITQDFPLERRLKLELRAALDAKAALTGHTGRDGRLRDYDAVVDFELGGSMRTLGPAGLVHGHPARAKLSGRVVLVGLKPGMSTEDLIHPDHVGMARVDFSLSVFGDDYDKRDLDDATIAKLEQLAAMLTAMLVKRSGDEVMLEGEKEYFDRAACLKAVFDPADLGKLEPGSKRDAGVAVRSTVDDKEQSFDLLVSATGASVAPDGVHAAPGAPGRFSLTAPAKEGPISVVVDGTSVRGRVTGALGGKVEATPKAWGYSVRLEGEGSYTEDRTYDDASSNRRDHHRTTFAFDDRWGRLVLPADGSQPLLPLALASSGRLTGTVVSNGSRHEDNPPQDSTYTCTAALADENAAPGVLPLTLAAAPGAPVLTIRAVHTLFAGAGQCNTTGTAFLGIIPSTGGVGINDTGVALQAKVTVPTGEIGRPSFTMAVQTPGVALLCSGGNTGGSTCTHDLQWRGIATFTKIERCDSLGGGYSCKPL